MKSMMLKNTFPAFWDDMDAFFRAPTENGTFSPAIEIKKNENEYKLAAHLPGVKKEDVHVSIENGYLTISGKMEKREEKEYEMVRSEIASYTEFQRSLKIDETAFDADRVEAKIADGILEVVLPLAEKVKPRQIEVKVK